MGECLPFTESFPQSPSHFLRSKPPASPRQLTWGSGRLRLQGRALTSRCGFGDGGQPASRRYPQRRGDFAADKASMISLCLIFIFSCFLGSQV